MGQNRGATERNRPAPRRRLVVITSDSAVQFNEEIEKFLSRPHIQVDQVHLHRPVAVGDLLHFTAFVEYHELG